MRDKKPREFWIRDNEKHYGAKNNKYACFDTKEGVSKIDYHVREVLPDEPDYKKAYELLKEEHIKQLMRVDDTTWKMLAHELAEALKEIAQGAHVLCEGMADSKTTSKLNFNPAYCDCYIRDAKEALAKYEEMKK